MPRKKMTKGEISSRAARQRLKEIKRTVPDGFGGEIRMSFYGSTRDEAEAKHQEHLRSLQDRRPDSDELKRGEMAWWYHRRYAPLKQHLRPASKAALDLAFEHLWRHMGHRQAKTVGAPEIVRMLAAVGGSASLRNKVRGLALDLMDLAAEEDAEVRPVPRRRVPRAKERPPALQVLSPVQARALCESLSPHYRPAAFLMAFLGLRSGEAIAVVGGDLTPIGTLTVRRQDDGHRGWTNDLKTEESRRELPLPQGLYERVVTHREGPAVPLTRTRDTTTAGRTVHGTQVSEATLRRAVAAARERLQLPTAKGHTLHALRHGCATWLATNGCPDSVRLTILGQSRARVSDRYVHASPAAMLPYLNAMWEASEGAEAKPAERKGNEKNHATGMRNGRARIDDAMRNRILDRLAKGGDENAVKKIARDENVSPKAVRNVRERALTSTSAVVAATTIAEVESPAL